MSNASKAATAAAPRLNLYTRVTASIIRQLEQGTRPWVKPWAAAQGTTASALPLRANGIPYRGINIVLLWGAAFDAGFTSSSWMTYRQAAESGGQVRKGERGSTVVYANRITTTEADDAGVESERDIPFLKAYTVFNADQIDGLPVPDAVSTPTGAPAFAPIAAAETFFAATGADIRHGGSRAYYAPVSDHIQLPPPQAFRDAESYTATKAHELIHWTGHQSRNDRTFGKRFGDHAYAVEELVAELGAAFLCAMLGIAVEPRDDHAAYLTHWLYVLKADNRAIFAAASAAQRAADALHNMQGQDKLCIKKATLVL